MGLEFNHLQPLQQQLNQHAVYANLSTMADLRCFMEHHVFSVWDFMSIVKYLQQKIAPANYPWLPLGDANVRRFINELVMEEESDQTEIAGVYSSHFELYCRAMAEVGARAEIPLHFIKLVQDVGVDEALNADMVPVAAREFTRTTFDFINADKAHCVAAALALGREKIIPMMFREFLAKMQITAEQAPIFHFYLNRHIYLDQDFHGPLSMRLLQELCDNDAQKMLEAEQAAYTAIRARIRFWDGVSDCCKTG